MRSPRRLLSAIASIEVGYLFSFCAMIAVSGCASDPDRAVDRQNEIARDPAVMMRIAEAAEKGGDINGAETFYRRATELAPDFPAAEVGLARTVASRGNVDQALVRLRDAHARNPADTEIAGALGRLLVAKDPSGALNVYEDGLRVDPRSSSLLVGRGVALDALDRHQEAQTAYRAALEINPGSESARKDLALSIALERGSAKTNRKKRNGSDNLDKQAEVGSRS